MERQFPTGQIVQLKSGGPMMTVDQPIGNHSVLCVWFEGTTRQQGPFKVAALKIVDAPE